MTTQLTANFTLEEMAASATATRLGIPNDPDAEERANLTRLCETILQPRREAIGVRIYVHDAFRCDAVNASVGGVPTSQHRRGLAADIEEEGKTLRETFDEIRASDLPFDQVILESGCVHVSAAEMGNAPRRQALIRSEAPPWTYSAA